MTETDLAAAIKNAVNNWLQTTPTAQQQADMLRPALLSAVLGLTAQIALQQKGLSAAAVRAYVLQTAYCHFKDVFDASALVDTPVGFHPIPDTPSTIGARAAVLALHGLLQLETVAYGSENNGNLFVNLVALPGPGAFSEKSRKGMRGHTDAVSLPFNGEDDPQDQRIAPSPDVVTLAALRNPDNVPTRLISLTDALALLQKGDIDELKKPQYSIRSQKTFVQGMKRVLGKEHVVIDGPVLRDVGSSTYIRYSHSSVVPSITGGPAEHAANNLEAICSQIAIPVVIQPGDVLSINNRLSLHGRGKVGEMVGGQSRWLFRTYGLDTSNLPASKRHGGSHTLFP